MTKPNVLFEDTGVTHARSAGFAMTRCGLAYDRHKELPFNMYPRGIDTEKGVDCMTCLVKDPGVEQWKKYEKGEWNNADIAEVLVENSVKDIQEAVDMRYIDAIEWQKRKESP